MRFYSCVSSGLAILVMLSSHVGLLSRAVVGMVADLSGLLELGLFPLQCFAELTSEFIWAWSFAPMAALQLFRSVKLLPAGGSAPVGHMLPCIGTPQHLGTFSGAHLGDQAWVLFMSPRAYHITTHTGKPHCLFIYPWTSGA